MLLDRLDRQEQIIEHACNVYAEIIHYFGQFWPPEVLRTLNNPPGFGYYFQQLESIQELVKHLNGTDENSGIRG